MPLRTLCAVFDAVEADIEVVVRYRGGQLDRLMDAAHAATATALVPQLREAGWLVEVEVSFNHYGDRGSIDLLAYHPATRTLLVVEIKTEIASAEEMLRRLDVKARVAPLLAPERFGERPARVVRLLAVTASSANRSRVARLEPLLAAAFPLRGRVLAGWLRNPSAVPGGRPGGLLFVRNVSGGGVTQGDRRVRRSGAPRGGAPEREQGAAGGDGSGESRPGRP